MRSWLNACMPGSRTEKRKVMLMFFMNINKQIASKCHQGRLKFEINIPPQQIFAKSKGGLTTEGGVMLSEYNISAIFNPQPQLVLIP